MKQNMPDEQQQSGFHSCGHDKQQNVNCHVVTSVIQKKLRPRLQVSPSQEYTTLIVSQAAAKRDYSIPAPAKRLWSQLLQGSSLGCTGNTRVVRGHVARRVSHNHRKSPIIPGEADELLACKSCTTSHYGEYADGWKQRTCFILKIQYSSQLPSWSSKNSKVRRLWRWLNMTFLSTSFCKGGLVSPLVVLFG